jgi:hypothetical protein
MFLYLSGFFLAATLEAENQLQTGDEKIANTTYHYIVYKWHYHDVA